MESSIARDHGSPAKAHPRPSPSPRNLQPLRLPHTMPGPTHTQTQALANHAPNGHAWLSVESSPLGTGRALSSNGGDGTSPMLGGRSPALAFLNHTSNQASPALGSLLQLPQSMTLSARSMSAQQVSPDLTMRQHAATPANSLASTSPNPSPPSLSHSSSATLLSPVIRPRKASLPPSLPPSLLHSMLEQSKMHELSAMQASLVAAANHEQPKSSDEGRSNPPSSSTTTFLTLPLIGHGSGSAERTPEASPMSSSPSQQCGSAPREGKRFSFSQTSSAGPGIKPPVSPAGRGRAVSITSIAGTTAAPSASSSLGASLSSSAVPSPAATATITAEIVAKFGPLLGFFQSPFCRFFSRCANPVPIFQRDLAALCKGYSEPLPILRTLEGLNTAGAKFPDFKTLHKAVRRALKKQAISQLIGNGGAIESVFEDASLLEGQPFSSPLIRPHTDAASSTLSAATVASTSATAHRCVPPLDSELDALFDCAGGSLQRLSQVFVFFLLEESPPRNAFDSVAELVRATIMVMEGQELGTMGQRQQARPMTASSEHDASYDSGQMPAPQGHAAHDDSGSSCSLRCSLSLSNEQARGDDSSCQPSQGAGVAPVVSPLASGGH